jgi:ribosomal protein S18 acetylase RimI-like enzyme
VAVLHGAVVGAGFSSISYGIFSFDVVVAPDAQRTGAGTALVKALEADYYEALEPYPDLVLEVQVVDDGMMRLLMGRGYAKRWDRDALFMRLKV